MFRGNRGDKEQTKIDVDNKLQSNAYKNYQLFDIKYQPKK